MYAKDNVTNTDKQNRKRWRSDLSEVKIYILTAQLSYRWYKSYSPTQEINGLICFNVVEFKYAIWIMELHHIHDSLHAPSPFQWSRVSDSNSNYIGLFVKHLMVCSEPANNTLEFSLLWYWWLPDICQYHFLQR